MILSLSEVWTSGYSSSLGYCLLLPRGFLLTRGKAGSEREAGREMNSRARARIKTKFNQSEGPLVSFP